MSQAEVKVKICGLTRPGDVDLAVKIGAAYLGFVFFPRSPRHLSVKAAATLASRVPAGVAKVALTVNADDTQLDEILTTVPIDVLQLHGAESPDRVAKVKARFGLPVMKAVGIAKPDDVNAIDAYSAVADMLLVDAKPTGSAALPGGNGLSFDWRLIAGRRWSVPWMLAGGLNPDNVAEAIRLTGARQIDVSSGVESGPGHKDAERMHSFFDAVEGSVSA